MPLRAQQIYNHDPHPAELARDHQPDHYTHPSPAGSPCAHTLTSIHYTHPTEQITATLTEIQKDPPLYAVVSDWLRTGSGAAHRPYSLGAVMVRVVHHGLHMGNRTGSHPPSPPSHQPQDPHQPLHPRGNPAAALKPSRRSLVIFEVRTYISVYMNCFLVLCIFKA